MTAIPKKKRMQHSDDTERLGEALNALVSGYGWGGMTWLSRQLGFDISPLRRRLMKPGAGMDAVTMRAVVLVQASRADQHKDAEVLRSETVGPYVIETRKRGAEVFPTWRVVE